MRDTNAPLPFKHLARLAMVLVCGSSETLRAEGEAVSAFGPGEQTTYVVRYLGLAAGTAQVTVGWTMEQYGREVWPLVCVGRTADLAAVYPVNDRFVSYWDPVARAAVGSDFVADENRKRRRERYRYDFATSQAVATKQQEGKPKVKTRYALEPGTVDLASAAFQLRNEPLAVGQVHRLPIFTGEKLFRMQATVAGTERLVTPLGALEVFRVTVNTDFSGQLATKGLLTLFYTTDERRLPVRAEADFLFGKVVLEAVNYEPGMRFAGGT